MAKHKALSWAAIKKRYLYGEPPKKIAEDYGIEPKSITNKAYKESWGRQKETIRDNISSDVEDDLKALCTATIKVHRLFMERMLKKNSDGQDMIQALEHPFLTDGEKVNSLYQTAMNNSVKIYQSVLKAKEDEEVEEEPPGFVISTDA